VPAQEIQANLDAERALLGAMLLDAEVADAVIAKMAADSLFSESHRVIIKAIQAVRAQGGAVDLVTVTEALRQAGTLAQIGGATYISALANSVPNVDHWEDHLRIVQEKAALRTIASGAAKAKEQAEAGDMAKALATIERARAEAAAMTERRGTGISLVKVAEAETLQVNWLWKPYIPMECITLLEGDPKTGKTWMALAITAIITRGFPLPGEDGRFHPREPGNVLYLTAEDSIGMTLKPRLEKANADTGRVVVFEGKIGRDKKTIVPINMQDLPQLDEALERVKPVLMVIDSMVPHLGPKVDSNKAEQVVPVLNGVARLAEKHSCACLIIRHLAKGPRERALYKGQGTISIAGVARSILMVGIDPNEPSKRVMVHSACNLAKEGPGQSFAITDDGALEWCGISEVSAAELVAPEVIEQSGARADAKKFLRGALAQGPRSAVDMEDEADANGIAPATLKRARKELNIRAFKLAKAWYWELPKKEEDQKASEGIG